MGFFKDSVQLISGVSNQDQNITRGDRLLTSKNASIEFDSLLKGMEHLSPNQLKYVPEMVVVQRVPSGYMVEMDDLAKYMMGSGISSFSEAINNIRNANPGMNSEFPINIGIDEGSILATLEAVKKESKKICPKCGKPIAECKCKKPVKAKVKRKRVRGKVKESVILTDDEVRNLLESITNTNGNIFVITDDNNNVFTLDGEFMFNGEFTEETSIPITMYQNMDENASDYYIEQILLDEQTPVTTGSKPPVSTPATNNPSSMTNNKPAPTSTPSSTSSTSSSSSSTSNTASSSSSGSTTSTTPNGSTTMNSNANKWQSHKTNVTSQSGQQPSAATHESYYIEFFDDEIPESAVLEIAKKLPEGANGVDDNALTQQAPITQKPFEGKRYLAGSDGHANYSNELDNKHGMVDGANGYDDNALTQQAPITQSSLIKKSYLTGQDGKSSFSSSKNESYAIDELENMRMVIEQCQSEGINFILIEDFKPFTNKPKKDKRVKASSMNKVKESNC